MTEFAAVVGYREENLCPGSGLPCPAKETVIMLYPEDNGIGDITFDHDAFNPDLDGFKRRMKLGEIEAWATVKNCAGTEEGNCPARESMNNSPTRTTVVSGLRSIRRALRKTEK